MKSLKKKITIEEWDWNNIPVGSKFKGTIDDIPVEGRIQKEFNCIFLCQDSVNGGSCTNKLDYDYSYNIFKGSCREIEKEGVVITSITLDPKFKPPVQIYIKDNLVVFNKGSITVGCTTVDNKTIREIVKHLKN